MTKSNQIDRIYEFSGFRLDTRQRVLLLNGKPVTMEGKVFDTLLVLVENQGKLISTAELMEEVWGDVAIEESNLTVKISNLRKLLGDDAKNPRYIQTVPKQGYRFVASVKELSAEQYDVKAQEHTGPTHKAHQVPPLPSHFISRLEVSETIKARILTREQVAPGTLVLNAIHGLAGSGKTTLVASLAHNSDVRAHFSSGILWATLGQEPDVLSLLNSWLEALGDYSFRATVEAASWQLRSLLQDKSMLLVLDDVWNASHARHFLVGSPCQMIISTRRVDVADDLGGVLWELGAMTSEQSLQLLSARLGYCPEEPQINNAMLVVRAVGYLPLALELVASRVARGISWDTLLSAIEDEISCLEALEDPRRRRQGQARLEASFNLSLDALRREDEAAWRAFAWLGVLPDDVFIAAPMAATLWNTDVSEASRILELLWNDALLLPDIAVRIGESTWLAYRLHDLLHDHARRLLMRAQPQGLNLTLREANTAFLDHYRARYLEQDLPYPSWHTLPNDGYIYAHLVWHMEQAGRVDEIHRMLSTDNTEGGNAWFQTRNRSGDIAGFLQDIARAWQLAEENSIEQIRQGNLATTVGLEVRYALASTSINSLAMNFPPEVLSEFVSRKLWTQDQALAYAWRIPDSEQRVKALMEIASLMCGQEREAVVGEVVDTLLDKATENHGYWLSKFLWQNVDRLAKLGLIEKALQMARIINIGRATTLLKIIPWLPEGLRVPVSLETLEAIKAKDEKDKTDALTLSIKAWSLEELAEYLPEPLRSEAIIEGLAAARAIRRPDSEIEDSESEENEYEEVGRVTHMARFLPLLTEPLKTDVIGEVLANARAIKDKPSRARTMADSIPYLPEPIKSEVLQEALAIARTITNANDRAWQLK